MAKKDVLGIGVGTLKPEGQTARQEWIKITKQNVNEPMRTGHPSLSEVNKARRDYHAEQVKKQKNQIKRGK